MDNKRYIGRVTTGATIGTAMASSVAVILGFVLSQVGITLPPAVQDAAFILLSCLGALIGGRQSPSDKVTFEGLMEAAASGVTGKEPLPTGATNYPVEDHSNVDYTKFEVPRDNVPGADYQP